MKLNTPKTFFASLFILAALIFQFVLPLDAHAQLGVREQGDTPGASLSVLTSSEPVTQPQTIESTPWILRYLVNPAARAVVRSLLTSLTQQVVNWISADGGNNVGFVGNFEQTLTNELDDVAGNFLQQLDVVDFCGNIGAYLKLNLRVPAGGLRQRAKCSLSAIVSNVQNFYDNFQNGGWEAFLKTNVDIQNNTAGAFLISLDAKIAMETRRKEEFGAKYAKSGILGISKKTQVQCWPRGDKPPPPTSGYKRTGSKEITGGADDGQICINSYEEQTPGSVIEQTLKDANKTGIDFGIAAKDYDEAISEIISALLQRTISSAHGIFGQSPNTTVSYGDPLFDYQELGPSQDSLRTRAEATAFTIHGALKSADDQVVALRKELTSETNPDRKLELARQTENILTKSQALLTEQNTIATAKLSSYYATRQSDVARIDDQISQTLNRVEPIAAELGSSPSASPTGDLKTDTIASINGSRTQLASHVALVRQAITEVTAAIGGLSTTSIVANQALFVTQANALSIEISSLAGDVSSEQSRISSLRQKLLAADAPRLIDDLKPKQNSIISTAEKISGELNDFAGALSRDQEQVSALKSKLVNPADGALIDNISVQTASLIADAKQLAAEIGKLAADISAEQTQTNALQEKLLTPQAVRLIGRLQGQANIVTEGDKTNAEISSLTDTIAEEKAQVSVLRQQLTSSQAGQLIADITTLTDAISNEQAQIGTLRQQLVTAESGQLISQISQLTDIIGDEQAQVAVLRQQLKTGTPAEINSQISELTDIIASEQAQVAVLRQQLKALDDTISSERAQIEILRQQLVSAESGQLISQISQLTDTIASEQAQVAVLRQQLTLTTGTAATQQIQADITAALTDITAKQLQIGTLRQQLLAIGGTVNVQIANLLADILVKQTTTTQQIQTGITAALTDITAKQLQIGTLRLQINSTAAAVNAQIATLLADIQSKQSQIGTLRRQLVAVGDAVNAQISNLLADILIKQTRISTLRTQLLAIGGAINTEIAQLLSDILLKQTRIRMLREDLVTIRDLNRFAADIAANQSRIISVPDQIRSKISKIITDLKTKQAAIKSLMQRLLTQPQSDLEAQREAQLENYMDLLTNPDGSQPGALEAIQEADGELRTTSSRLAGVSTIAEITGEVGESIRAIKKASGTQQAASQTMQTVFGFLDNLP